MTDHFIIEGKPSRIACGSGRKKVVDGLPGSVICASVRSVKMAKRVRTLEEICALEDQYPLIGSSPAGLMRWLYAVGLVGLQPLARTVTATCETPARRFQPTPEGERKPATN